MPKKDGLSAAKSIKFYMEECEIVIITANSEFEYAKEAIKLKVEDFLVKPYSVKSFKETISKLIEKLKKAKLQKEEKKDLENHFDKVKIIAEKDLILEIIKNNNLSEEILDNYLNILNLKNLNYISAIYKFKEIKKIPELMNELNREFSKAPIRILSSSYLDKLVVFIFTNEVSLLNQYYEKINQFFKRKEKTVLFASSSTQKDSSQVIIAFKEAKSNLNSILNSDSISYYDIPYDLENELFKAILETELDNQEKIIAKYIEDIFKYIVDKNENIDVTFITNYLKQLIIMIDRVIRKIIVEKNKIKNIEEIFQYIDSSSNLSEQKSILNSYIKDSIDIIGVFKDKKHVKIIEYAKQYIENNFDKNISLDDVAHHIGLSSNYLSKYFKKVENINFKDYATNIRIEKAKMLLETSDGNVTEIAEKLGYTDVSYFSYAFKKKTGFSPKEYYTLRTKNK